jgi:hypothetical protein
MTQLFDLLKPVVMVTVVEGVNRAGLDPFTGTAAPNTKLWLVVVDAALAEASGPGGSPARGVPNMAHVNLVPKPTWVKGIFLPRIVRVSVCTNAGGMQ